MIQIDIDMPKNCFECDKTYKWKKDGKVQCSHINMPSISSNTTNRPSYCPLKEVPSGKWIPVSERLPKDLEPVNVTWVNHNPGSYYADIKDKPFTATGVYFNGQWYWWSTLCTDILAEYSHNYDDIVADDVEITAWQPLPKPYEPQADKEQEDGNDD